MTAYTDFHYSPTGSGVISGAQVLEQTEQGINGLGQYVQDNISGAIDTANQALTIAQTADSNATLALNTANSFASAISAANNTANNALTTAQSAQNTANNAYSLATTANNSAATALNTANAASAGVTTLTGTVNSLGNRMTAAENAINTNAGNITTLQNNLATTNANVTAASNAANAAQATATSAQSTATLARNQAYVLRYTGTTITGGGTIAYADIDNTNNIKSRDKIIDISGAIYDIASVDIANQTVTVGASPVINLFCDAENLIPAANDSYDLGSSSYQWNNLYAKNYYYNGVAWGLDKANVWTQNQSVINASTPKFVLQDTRNDRTYSASASLSGGAMRWECDDKDGAALSRISTTLRSDKAVQLQVAIFNEDSSGNEFDRTIRFVTGNSGDAALYPEWSNTINLGTSTAKWKTLNGINPGALSLPKIVTKNTANIASAIVGSDGETQYLDGTDNFYTAALDGWISICISGFVNNELWITVYDQQDETWGTSAESSTRSTMFIVFPIRANQKMRIRMKCTSVDYARFYPCEGNV